MSRVLTALAGAVLVAAMFVYVPPASAAIHCSNKASHGYAEERIGPRLVGNRKTIQIHAIIWYRACNPPGHLDSARPFKMRFITNVSGTHMGCSNGKYGTAGYPGHYNTQFQMFAADAGGRNFRTRKVFTPCSSNTFASVTRAIGKRVGKALYWYPPGDGYAHPWARVNYTVDYRSTRDPSGSIRIKFKKR